MPRVLVIDEQGRVIIQPLLRTEALMTGEVAVLGQLTHLEVWNHDRFRAKLQREPFGDADASALSDLGI